MNRAVTRKAILIGSPGKGNNYLYGVEQDLTNVKNFLLSDKGGRWFSDEIITLSNASFNQVFSKVHSVNSDYLFIYFSGHGWTSQKNERMLSLRDVSISDLFLLNSSPRQLILIDACRNYVAPGIYGIPDLGERYSHYDGYYESRELFNRFIAASPFGKTIIHATQVGESSYDSPSGGYFTQALLNLSAGIKTDSHKAFGITKILEYVPAVLQRKNNFQIPSVTFKTGDLRVPFAIGVPQSMQPEIKWTVPQRQTVGTSNNSSGAGLAWLALGVLFFIAVSGSK